MRRIARALPLALLLAACAPEGGDPLLPPGAAPPAAGTAAALEPPAEPEAEALPEPEAGAGAPEADPGPETAAAPAADVPHVYMALQRDPAGPTSVILAIDGSRDGTPSDDPAIRITPVNGQCNPQQLRWYEFPPERAVRPVYGPDEAARGVTARDLPDYMAMAVTSEMLAQKLVGTPDESQPQNVCTRKLLQRIIIDRSAADG